MVRFREILTLTEEGRQHALDLLNAYDIKLDPDPTEQRFFRLLLRFAFLGGQR